MSASMAEVLAEHQLYVNTSHGDAWNPPEESASCSCGVDLGGWVASGADWEWPNGWGKEHGEHVAEALAANGYGKLTLVQLADRDRPESMDAARAKVRAERLASRAETIRRAKEDAWREGHLAGRVDERTANEQVNPYRRPE